MRRLFYLCGFVAVIYLFLTFKIASAHDITDDPMGKNSCSAWVKERNVTCIFNRESTPYWRRTCYDDTRICKPNDFHACDAEDFCSKQNPNEMTNICTDWVRVSNTRCYSKRTDSWEDAWVRSCVQHRVKTTECSKTKPE